MPTTEEWLLDQVAFNAMPVDLYCRVHPAQLKDGRPCDPLSANPYATGRLAMPPDLGPNGVSVGMYYCATTSAGALFEALLREAMIFSGREVYLPRDKLMDQCLSVVRLLQPVDIIPLGLPDRKIVVPDTASWRDARWRELINTGDHTDTHLAAWTVYDQVTAAGLPHHGLAWPSVQVPSSLVYLLYEPPRAPAHWAHRTTIALDTHAGDRFIADALAKAGYAWLADPSGGFDPDDLDLV